MVTRAQGEQAQGGHVLAGQPGWWAPGLTLAERLAGGAAGPPRQPRGGAGAPRQPGGGVTQRDRHRLDGWRAAHNLGETGQFARRLADAGVDEDDLLALLAEPPSALAARLAAGGEPPAWAAFVEHVLATAEPVVPAGELTWSAGFAAVLAPFVDAAWDRLAEAANLTGVDAAVLRQSFTERLTTRLVRCSARTLVLELNVLRVNGQLSGEDSRQRFASFARHFAGRTGLATLLGEYVVLARLIGQACLTAVDAYRELLRRLAADRECLVRTLLRGVEPGDLVSVDLRGDLHRGGRSVAILGFTDGSRVAYKPRPVEVHQHFNGLVEWLDGKVPGLALRTLAVVARPGYGWVEYAESAPCATTSEIGDFYRRLGALMALLYAVDGTDVHYENLVACGDQPVLVDLETLLQPPLPTATVVGPDPAAEAMAASVSRISLLPQLMFGEHGVWDVSGLGGDATGTGPFDVVTWDADGTDEMRLVRRPGPVAGSENRPRIGEVCAEPADHVEDLLAGFRVGCEAITAHRAELIAPDGPLSRCAGAEIRVVARATRLYGTLLDESTHPDVLRDALDRDRILDALWAYSAGDGFRETLVRHESADLWAGDVPIFVSRPGSRDLWTSRGERLPGVFAEPSLHRAVRKVQAMDGWDRLNQEWLIRASIAVRGQLDAHDCGGYAAASGPAAGTDPARILAAASGIADRIVAQAFVDRTRANWLGVEALDGQYWMVRPLGAGLAGGYTGVALFLGQMAALTGRPRYAEHARLAVSCVPALLAGLAASSEAPGLVGCGGFEGLGGIAYALSRLAVLLDDGEIGGWVAPAVDLAAAAIDSDEDYGVLDGGAGCLAAMLAVHRLTGLDTAWQAASRCAERLSAAIHPPAAQHPPAGFARGGTGIGWALHRFAAAGGGERYAALGLAALDRAGAGDATGWCHGAAGLVLAHASGPVDGYRLDAAVDAVLGAPPLRNHSLCHGELSNVEALAAAARWGHEPAAAALDGRLAGLMGAIERNGPRCGTPGAVDSPGLLNGLAGIGYGLLRVGFADRVPSVLLLAPDEC